MTVKDLKQRLENLDNDLMIIITDGKGWSNLDKIELNKLNDVCFVVETKVLFSNS